MKKLVSIVTAAAMCITAMPQFMGGGVLAEEIWKPNPINVREKLDRGLVAMQTEDGVYLSWRFQADEDNVYGTGSSNVSFDIYRDGKKIAVESYTTNYIDKEGTAGSKYQVVRSGVNPEDDKTSNTAVPFSSGSNYFDIKLDVPAPVSFPSDVTEDEAAEEETEDGTTETGGEEGTSDTVVEGKHAYTVGDTSTGDLDGDGEYELVVKWDCSPKDNSHNGYSGNVILSAYKLNGTHMWDIDLGPNIRSGAHYTQFLVYDFDGDGKAEITAKTAPGSKDGKKEYVTKAAKTDKDIQAVTDDENEISYVSTAGRILNGDEYFTIFDGETGAALDTIYYPNQRLAPSIWGDSDTYGNRVDRFTAAVAYLDGEIPYAVYMRGYYYGYGGQRQAACAVSYDGEKLDCHLSFDTYDVNKYKDPSGYTTSSFRKKPYSARNYKGVIGYEEKYKEYVGQGNHNCSVADVDGDGRDEVLTGAMCYHIDENGNLRPLWSTFKGHGDAMHIGDYDPTHDGYEFFVVHEEGGGHYDHGTYLDYGMSVIDPGIPTYGETGAAPEDIIMYHKEYSGDTGRGMMANVGSGGYYQFWGAGTRMSAGGRDFRNSVVPSSSSNFRIYWNGDLYDDLLDGTGIRAWNENRLEMEVVFRAEDCTSINGTKSVPALSADLFGDWREEVVFPTTDNTRLRVYTTDIYTEHKMKSLMYDNVYRCGVAAEQSGYNQPPHIGYYLDPKDGGEGKVDAAPTISLPQGAAEILHQNADSSTVGTYTTSLPEDVEGLSVNISKEDKSKYIAIVNQGLTNNVFKMVNGNYSTSNRAVTVDFADAVKNAAAAAVADSKYTELTFVVKLFDGTDGTTGALYLLSNTTGNKKNNDYANKIAAVTTNELPEGEWGVVRYEYTNGAYNLYLNDEKIASGTTTTALPILAMPFTNLSGNAPYTSMIFDDLYVYSISPETAPTPAPTATPEPTKKPLGAAPIKTDSVITEDFEQETNIFSDTAKVTTDPAAKGKNGTNIFHIGGKQSATSKNINSGKTKTYVEMDFRFEPPQENTSSALVLRNGNKEDIINITVKAASSGFWGTCTINGNDITTGIKLSDRTYSGWNNHESTGWIKMYAALDFKNNRADVSLIRISDNSVVYSGTLDFINNADSLEYIYLSIPKSYGNIWVDNIDISADPEAEITGLTITPPAKTKYFTGEKFDTDGLEVAVNYSDESSYELTPLDYDVIEPDMATEGTKAVEVTFGETTGTFDIEVSDKKITELSVISNPTKTRYLTGENLNTAGLVLRADYDDGSYETITDGYTLSGFESSAVGEKTVTAAYGEKTAEFTVNVVNEDELIPTPTPKPTARPVPTPRPAATDDPNEPEQTNEEKHEVYALDVSGLQSGNVTNMVLSAADRANSDVADFGTRTDTTAAVSALDGWGYHHVTYNGSVVTDKGNPYRQTTANVRADENTFYVQGDGTCSGGAISFIAKNKDNFTLNADGVDVYEFDAVVTSTNSSGDKGSPSIGFTSYKDGTTVSSVASVSLASAGKQNVETVYKMTLVNDKANGKYYIYKDGILAATGDSENITGVYAQTVNKYIKIGFRDFKLYEQTKLPVSVRVAFKGDGGRLLTEYPSVLSGTELTAPEAPIVKGKTFVEWRDSSGNEVTKFTAGYKTTVYTAVYNEGSTISSVYAYVDRFAKIILELGDKKQEKYSDIYGMATFENIEQGVYSYKIEKEGYTTENGELTLGQDDEELESELAFDIDHTGYLYYEADWTDGAGYITDGSANSFTTDLGPVNIKLPKTDGNVDVFDVTVKAKAANLANSGAAATWLLNSDEGALLGLHWAQGDGIYAITGWSGSSSLKNSTDTLDKSDNMVKIAEADALTGEITVTFYVDPAIGTIIITISGERVGSLPMVKGVKTLNTMSAGVTNAADDIYIYSLAVNKPSDNYMAIAGDPAVAKISDAAVTRQYKRSEAKSAEGEEFTWSITAPNGAAENAVSIDQDGLLTIKDSATAGTYTINCASKSNSGKKASLEVEVKDFQPLTLRIKGANVCDFRNTDEIKYELISAVDTAGAEVLDKIPSPVWSSSDTSVAEIDAGTGVLTMKKPGIVTIKATVNNGGVKSEESVDVKIVNYYITTNATMNTTIVNISSLTDEHVTGYQVTTATTAGEQKSKYIVDKGNVTDNTLTINTQGADKVEIAPIFSVSEGIVYQDERYTLNVPADTYDISVTASGQRVDIYANNQLLVNNILQHGSTKTAVAEVRRDIKVREDYITIKTSDYASDKVNASWTTISNITAVKSPSIVKRTPKMYVLGDSLVAKYYNGGSAENGLARSGWGQVLENYIVDTIDVVPLGNSGITAKGLYATAFTQIRESAAEGDYLILESGYNDQTYNTKDEMREAITGMYNEATEKGVKVILVSPNASYHDYKESVAWTSYMAEFANELDAEYINLAGRSYEFLIGEYGNEFGNYYEYYNVDDKLHSTYNGAQKWASVVAQGIYDLGHTDIVNTQYTYIFSDGANDIVAKVIPKERAKPELTAPTVKTDLVYTGEIQELLACAAQTTGGTLEYSTDNEYWFDDIEDITAVDAGVYTVYYRATGNDEYIDSDTESVRVTIAKAEQAAPQGITSTAVTAEAASDGIISGVTEDMEYRVKGGTYAPVTGTAVTNLAAGDYEVRYAADENHNAGAAASVQVNLTISGTITWNYAYSYTISDGREESGVVPNAISQRSATATVELLNRGEVYRTDTVNAGAAAENAADGIYKFTDVPVSIDGIAASYSIKVTPLVAREDSDTEQTVEAENYSVTFTDTNNRNANINYNPNCFDAAWTVNIEAVDTIEDAVPDTVYVKVLYGTTASGVQDGIYSGYDVITQQVNGNGTACPLTDNGNGSYTAAGKYPVWKYQPDGTSYFHKAIVMGYTVNGTYIDCTGKNFISPEYMQYDTETDKADKNMVITIESLSVPVVEFNANGGSLDVGYILGTAYGVSVSSDEISAKAPEWENHTFDGWYDSENGGNKVTEINELTAKTTLYAKWKENQSAPTGLTARKASSETAKDGSISGVTDKMEYSTDDGATWTAVPAGKTVIENLGGGDVLVRYAETDGKNAGESVTVSVGVKANQSKPTGITATGASSQTEKDGSISGVTNKMEYRKTGGEFADVTETMLTDLEAGEYEIRYKGDENHNAGEIAVVSVGYTLSGAVTWHYDYSYYPSGGGELQSGVVPNTISQRSRTARVELLNRGEVYRTVTVSAATVDEKTARADYVFNDIPASIGGENTVYSVNIIPLVAANDTEAEQSRTAESYSVTSASDNNLDANIYYNPNCFDAEWTVEIKNIETYGGAAPDTVYVKVLYGTTEEGAENGQYNGYGIITQQQTGNGTACLLTKNGDGTYAASGKYPVWKYQPNGSSYFHKVIITGYTVNGVYVDCMAEKYISEGFMQYDTETDSADKTMAITIENLEMPYDAPEVTPARDDIAIKASKAENGVKLIIDTMQSGISETELYKAVYNDDKSLKSVTKTTFQTDEDGKITVLLTEPTASSGEGYKLMLWDTEQSPIILAITGGEGFFD